MKGSQEKSENIIFLTPQPNSNTSSSKDKILSPYPNVNSILPFFLELTDRIRGSMAAMKTLAFYSRENFKDRELGDYFYRVVTEDIEKTISVLDCFFDYLNINNPVRKVNTINTFLEEIIKENHEEFKKKNIRIVKKQFEPDLPETTLSDEQLRFILNSVFDYILFSAPVDGGMGIVTRSIESNEWSGEGKDHLQKDTKYIEILFLSKFHSSMGSPSGSFPPIPDEIQEEKMDLILQLVKKTVENHRGAIRSKGHPHKGMNIISLVLPVERRNLFQFAPPGSRPKKWEKPD